MKFPTMLLKLKRDKRGLSNVLVVVLSLVILVVIVSNVILWSYQMNQCDWEKAQESIKILYVGQNSSWFVVQEEFSLKFGSRLSGNYLDTWHVDRAYESFIEERVGTSYSDWFNYSWVYRKPIDINNTQNPSQLTDFQVLITIDTASLINEGKMRPDCGDIRFTDTNGTLLNYWIESGINTKNTKIWVKIPQIPASSVVTIYMYYGNPLATSQSDPTTTFDFFDDFEDLDNWNMRGTLSTTLIDENKTVVKISSASGSPEGIYTKNFFDVKNKIIELEIKGFGNSDLDAAVYVDTSWATSWYGSTNLNHFIGDNYAGNRHTVYIGGQSRTGSQYLHSTWSIATFIIEDSKVTGKYFGETLTRTGTPSTYTGFIALQADNDGSPSTRYYYVDWIRVRKYASQEPSINVGEEEACAGYRFDLEGTFEIDLSEYPIESIQTVEVTVLLCANNSLEKFFLEAYNWISGNFSDAGFNQTEGYVPTENWGVYCVSLTENWQSYIASNGTVLLKLRDEKLDGFKTRVDINFMAIRVLIKGISITLMNDGPLTVHIVSLWINNATYHRRYDADYFINSGNIDAYVRIDLSMPKRSFTLKVVTDRGNIAVYRRN